LYFMVVVMSETSSTRLKFEFTLSSIKHMKTFD
jgi:hypothetical protein